MINLTSQLQVTVLKELLVRKVQELLTIMLMLTPQYFTISMLLPIHHNNPFNIFSI